MGRQRRIAAQPAVVVYPRGDGDGGLAHVRSHLAPQTLLDALVYPSRHGFLHYGTKRFSGEEAGTLQQEAPCEQLYVYDVHHGQP